MKKIIPIILSIALMLCLCAVSANAQFYNSNKQIARTVVEYFEDGTVLKVTVSEHISHVIPMADTYIKSGTKTYTLEDANGNEIWWFNLHGSFKVTSGTSATCTSSSHSYSIQDDSWSLKSATTSKSGSKAIGEATFIKKLLLVTTDTKDISLTLNCDKNGNLS